MGEVSSGDSLAELKSFLGNYEKYLLRDKIDRRSSEREGEGLSSHRKLGNRNKSCREEKERKSSTQAKKVDKS